jgi:putative membrane protein
MWKALLVAWLIIAAAIAVAALVVPSVEVDGGVFAILGIALVFGLVNALVGPLLRLVSAPLTVVTLGLFALVVNAVLLALTAGVSDSLEVGGFLATVVAAALISLLTTVLSYALLRLTERQPVA